MIMVATYTPKPLVVFPTNAKLEQIKAFLKILPELRNSYVDLLSDQNDEINPSGGSEIYIFHESSLPTTETFNGISRRTMEVRLFIRDSTLATSSGINNIVDALYHHLSRAYIGESRPRAMRNFANGKLDNSVYEHVFVFEIDLD